jgi:hypothetical protein
MCSPSRVIVSAVTTSPASSDHRTNSIWCAPAGVVLAWISVISVYSHGRGIELKNRSSSTPELQGADRLADRTADQDCHRQEMTGHVPSPHGPGWRPTRPRGVPVACACSRRCRAAGPQNYGGLATRTARTRKHTSLASTDRRTRRATGVKMVGPPVPAESACVPAAARWSGLPRPSSDYGRQAAGRAGRTPAEVVVPATHRSNLGQDLMRLDRMCQR